MTLGNRYNCKHPQLLADYRLLSDRLQGGEEDGVNNEDVDNNSLYTQPEDIYNIYKTLSAISPFFSIAYAFHLSGTHLITVLNSF